MGVRPDSYDSSSNQTTISFSGSGLATSGPYTSTNTGDTSTAPHFGFTGVLPGISHAVDGQIPPVTMGWSQSSSTSIIETVPFVSTTFYTGFGGAIQYLMLLIDVDGQTNWYESLFEGSYGVTFSNTTSSPIDLSDAHYFISDSFIPLGELTDVTYPDSNSAWLPLMNVDGTILAPGQSINVGQVPEPAGMAVLVPALLCLAATRRALIRR